MRQLIRAVTGTRALVLVLEDLHWADDATLELIARIMRSGDPGALLVLGTFRSGTFATSGAVVERLARFQSAGDATLLTLTELTQEDVRQCLDLRFGSPVTKGLAPVLYSATSGHPQYMVAALDELLAAGFLRHQSGRWTLAGTPARVHRSIHETVLRVIARRLGRLPPRARMLLGTAAHIGARFDVHIAGTVADIDVSVVEEECDRLVGEGFLEQDHHKELPDGTHAAGYRFRRDIERAALQQQTLPAAAARLKRRVADALPRAI
jgi:predicted ATPase